jgi:hypothetical protein
MPKIGRDTVRRVMLDIQARAKAVGRLSDDEQVCFDCGEVCTREDLDKPADFYYCDACGNSWCDTASWADRMADHADYLRKRAKEEGQ